MKHHDWLPILRERYPHLAFGWLEYPLGLSLIALPKDGSRPAVGLRVSSAMLREADPVTVVQMVDCLLCEANLPIA